MIERTSDTVHCYPNNIFQKQHENLIYQLVISTESIFITKKYDFF